MREQPVKVREIARLRAILQELKKQRLHRVARVFLVAQKTSRLAQKSRTEPSVAIHGAFIAYSDLRAGTQAQTAHPAQGRQLTATLHAYKILNGLHRIHPSTLAPCSGKHASGPV